MHFLDLLSASASQEFKDGVRGGWLCGWGGENKNSEEIAERKVSKKKPEPVLARDLQRTI